MQTEGVHKDDDESKVGRNPHPDFKKVEASREPWENVSWHVHQTVNPNWKVGITFSSRALEVDEGPFADGFFGSGGGARDSSWKNHKKIEIDPYAEGRKATDNYKLLISGIVPRFVHFRSLHFVTVATVAMVSVSDHAGLDWLRFDSISRW